MIKKFLFIFLLLVSPAYSAVTGWYPMANVGYVSEVAAMHGCTLNNNADSNMAVNMEYLLQTIDICNGHRTNYGSGTYATQQAANTVAVNDVFERLIEEFDGFHMFLTNMPAGATFGFHLAAAGNFTIDWGDGSPVQVINRTVPATVLFSHTYAQAGNYMVTLNGLATAYNAAGQVAAISFQWGLNTTRMTGISGDIGQIFPILGPAPGDTPHFMYAFAGTGITAIPPDLFAGLRGAFIPWMFYATFQNCTNLQGIIPGTLFSGLSGAPLPYIFGLTFHNASGLTGIGEGLFDGLNGPEAVGMFAATFQGTTGLTGPSARSGGQFIYEKWPGVNVDVGPLCYAGATGLSDFANIPSNWK